MKDKLPLESGLYVTATPIGNLGDITLRALAVLKSADAILCEDTRVTAKLLHAHGIATPLIAYHDHNADRVRPEILKRLEKGEKLALVSDAGTPLISDPGFKLVREAKARGLTVIPVPGPSAVVAALSVAGLATGRFSFFGFLPEKAAARKAFLEGLKGRGETLVFFESAKRAAAALRALAEILGSAREASMARELTKTFEEVLTLPLGELAENVAKRETLKGEVVLLVAGSGEEKAPAGAAEAALRQALKTLSVKDAAAVVAALTGRSKKELYTRALKLKGKA
ncbi:MAG TPA: 16S rRNA (cytidine(1402)-2'-O)-methyltransferase [Sphingomonadales bacterium]|nr:16S rRNA (cytidine(1402)-2'-O)-methyltransferase [Sphingomonadales bacterium]